MATQIILEDIPVMYIESIGGVKGSKQAFDALEAKLPTLKGRKFYGLVFGTPPDDRYFASVAILGQHEPDSLGLKTYIVPGGKYIQERIVDWNNNIEKIGQTFQSLESNYQIDTSKPCVEFYRSMSEMLIRVPIQ